MKRKQALRALELASAFVCLALGLGVRHIGAAIESRLLILTGTASEALSVMIVADVIKRFFREHGIDNGLDYFVQHWMLTNELGKQLVDAGFVIDRVGYIDIPEVELSFAGDFSSATLRIRNALKWDRRLDDVVMSAALGKFIVERHYSTDDENYYVYELVDGSTSFKLSFNSLEEFKDYNVHMKDYSLFLDARSVVRLQHTLLVGVTGSGKTYALYSLILQMLYKNKVRYHLYYADPKGSSLAVIGYMADARHTAVETADIIDLLEDFVYEMRRRKEELKKRLNEKVNSDYTDFGMEPFLFICDEYASFAAVLSSMDKKVRDKVRALMYEVILQGRQLGFFLMLVMQKSDATLIDTALRDNITLKIVLGESGTQTYVTTYGASADIPNRHYLVGEGVFSEPLLAPTPKLVQFPYLNFDILRAVNVVKTPVV